MMVQAAQDLLTVPTDAFVEITAQVHAAVPGAPSIQPQYVLADAPQAQVSASGWRPIEVASMHVDQEGTPLDSFGITWSHGAALATEYNWGLSVFHDVKDHRLYGLGITPLTEIQTLVQTLYGRACAAAGGRRPDPGSWRPMLYAAIKDELFGPRGPRVYDPRARGLLAEHVPAATGEQREQALRCMWLIATRLMLPPLARLYTEHDAARELQRPLREQGELIRQTLDGVVWADEERMLLRLSDNLGLKLTVRAPVDPQLHAVSRSIRHEVQAYVDAERLVKTFGLIFDCARYTLSSASAAPRHDRSRMRGSTLQLSVKGSSAVTQRVCP